MDVGDGERRPRLLARVWIWLRWPAALGILGWLAYTNVYKNADDLLERRIDWWAAAAAAGCYAAAFLLTIYRWYLLVWAQEFRFGFGDAVRLGLVGALFNFVAPGSVGGDVVKGAMIARQQQSRRLVAASTVFLDRCVGTLGLFLLGGFVFLLLPAWYRRGALAIVASAFAIASAVGIALLVVALVPGITRHRWFQAMVHWRYVGRFLKGTLDAIRLYQDRWRVVVFCVLVSMVAHVGMLSTFYLCAKALARGSAVPGYGPHFVFGAGSNFIQAFIPTPGGVGAFEGALATGYEATDGLTVDHWRATRPDSPPPDWPAAFHQVLEHGDDTRSIAARHPGLARRELRETLEDVVEKRVAAGRAFGSGAGETPAAAVWEAYRAGHGRLAFREGLLAGLGFRVLTVLVAIVGAVLYFASRREFDAALHREVEPPPSEASAPP